MKIEMITDQDLEGYHYWKDAVRAVDFLANNHRHLFRIRCGWTVNHGNREKEIFIYQRKVEDALKLRFGTYCQFGQMSCEGIACWILGAFGDDGILWCEVLEDGRGGARVSV